MAPGHKTVLSSFQNNTSLDIRTGPEQPNVFKENMEICTNE